MTYEQYEKRVVTINGWFDTYIRETFRSVHQFGHLVNNHLNKSDAFLKDRCKKIKKNTNKAVHAVEDFLDNVQYMFK